MNRKLLEGLNSTFVTLLALALVIVFLSPFAFMLFISLKTREQISVVGAPIWPAAQPKFTYDGKEQDVFKVPRLHEINEQGRKAVVLMDEVQMLKSREIMEEFRGLLNMETGDGKMVNFIFFGLPDLDQVLSLDEPLKQRVAIRIRLTAYSEENTKDYISHRLHVAGCNNDIFTDKAISLIYYYSNGVPRLINTICDNALLEGFLFKHPAVDESIIKTVAIDLGLEN